MLGREKMTSYNYPLLAEQDMVPRYVHKGGFARVYDVSSAANLVAKIPFSSDCLDELIRESLISERLYAAGISVPQPRGMFNISWQRRNEVESVEDRSFRGHLKGLAMALKTVLNKDQPGFVMEKIKGIRLDYLYRTKCKSLFNHAQELLLAEVDKAESLGFFSGDAGKVNTFYIPDQDKVVLFDFEMWETPDLPIKRVTRW